MFGERIAYGINGLGPRTCARVFFLFCFWNSSVTLPGFYGKANTFRARCLREKMLVPNIK